MPHLKLEYSSNISNISNLRDLFAKCHRILAEVTGIRIQNCKSRSYMVEDYYISDGTKEEVFVHLEVRFIEGKSEEIKKQTGEALLECLKEFFDSDREIQISVELLDIEKASYFKYPALIQI